ncbi:hypothetical protein Tco_0386590 [Tanacetum coccineum]
MTWVSWDKVLVSKQKGGLGVSSYFALNRAILFKWLWCFISKDVSLWSRCIQAFHGIHGSLDGPRRKTSRKSSWLDIIKEMKTLNPKVYISWGFVPKGGEWCSYIILGRSLDGGVVIEVPDVKKRGNMDGEDVKKREKKMNSGYVVENVLIRYGGSLVGNERNTRYNKYKEGLCELKFEDEDEEDEDKDEIKGLIWVYIHISNKREKSGHM